MTALEMVHLYETLVRENFSKTYRIHRQSKYMQLHKNTFKRLKAVLDVDEIPIEDFMRVQFMNKGYRPYPNQMMGKDAMHRWEEHKRTENIVEMHKMQEKYLAQFVKQGYTVEEALSFDMFHYYFRCMTIKDHPKIWEFYAKKEIEKMPELTKIINEM